MAAHICNSKRYARYGSCKHGPPLAVDKYAPRNSRNDNSLSVRVEGEVCTAHGYRPCGTLELLGGVARCISGPVHRRYFATTDRFAAGPVALAPLLLS